MKRITVRFVDGTPSETYTAKYWDFDHNTFTITWDDDRSRQMVFPLRHILGVDIVVIS